MDPKLLYISIDTSSFNNIGSICLFPESLVPQCDTPMSPKIFVCLYVH